METFKSDLSVDVPNLCQTAQKTTITGQLCDSPVGDLITADGAALRMGTSALAFRQMSAAVPFARMERGYGSAALYSRVGLQSIDAEGIVRAVRTACSGALSRKRRSVVYFIQSSEGTGLIKIGVTDDLPQRLKDIQAYSPVHLKALAAASLPRECEKILHFLLESDRAHFEWFRPTDRIVRVARELEQNI